MSIPSFPDLIQDISTILYSYGFVRYKMSMVDKAWYEWCTRDIKQIKYVKDVREAVRDWDVLCIVRSLIYEHYIYYGMTMELCFEKWDTKLIIMLFKQRFSRNNGGIYGACRGGNLELVKWCMQIEPIEKDSLLIGACRGGHADIIRYAIDNGSTNWNSGLYGACRGGHMNVALDMIARGAHCDWYMLFYDVCSSGSVEMVQWILNADPSVANRDMLYEVCNSGNKKLVQLFIDRGNNNWVDGLYGACTEGHVEIAQMLIPQAGTRALNRGLTAACTNGYFELANLMIAHGATKCTCGESMETHLNIIPGIGFEISH